MTSEQSKPAPLVPAECNLRGFPWMALDTVRLLDSDLFLLATGDEFKAALALWCKSWSQVPAASLPNDDRLLGALSGAKNWKKVKAMAMRGWVLCSDDRWYHPVVAEKALEALPARKAHAEQKQANAERKERERADRRRLFELLRANGIVPEWDTKTTKLRELAAPFEGQPVTPPVTRDKSQPVTAITGQDSTGQDRTNSSVPYGTGDAGAPPATPPVVMTEREVAETMVKAAGVLAEAADERSRDEKAAIWRGGKACLWLDAGMDTAKAGALLGKHAVDYTEAVLTGAIVALCRDRPAGPVAWLKRALQLRAGEASKTNKQGRLEAANDKVGEGFLSGDASAPMHLTPLEAANDAVGASFLAGATS